MRFKVGLGLGLLVGYYFGAKAGRARYDQMHRWVQKIRTSDASDVAADKARAVIDLTVERAREALSQN